MRRDRTTRIVQDRSARGMGFRVGFEVSRDLSGNRVTTDGRVAIQKNHPGGNHAGAGAFGLRNSDSRYWPFRSGKAGPRLRHKKER